MNFFIHYSIKVLLRFFLRIFYIYPVKKNRVFFLNELSFTYGDSLKYVCEYLKDNYSEKYELIFPCKNEISVLGVNIIKPMSLKYFKLLLTSKFVIINAGGVSYVPIRKAQTVISTWHGGGPYKKTGTEVFDNVWTVKEAKMHANNVDYIMSSCKVCSEQEFKSMGIPLEKCLASGTPRVDVLFSEHTEIVKKVHEKYGIAEDTKIVLFAPTFRTDMSNINIGNIYQNSEIDIDYEAVVNAFEKRFGGKWCFAIRLHPKLKNVQFSEDIYNFTTYDDMQELLATVDAVITDYSSLMWDYSFTGKPCLLYATDIDEYEKTRGFYISYKRWPFPLATSNDELVDVIQNFNCDEYAKNVERHHLEAGSYEKGYACETIVDIINNKSLK